MHVLIGFAVIVGFVAFAFGSGTAEKFVRGVIYLVGFAVVIGFTVLVVAVVDELRPTPRSADSIRHLGKRGDAWMEPRTQATTGYAIDTYFPPTPRCGYACETSHSGLPRACWEFFDVGTPATQACKDALNEEKRASK